MPQNAACSARPVTGWIAYLVCWLPLRFSLQRLLGAFQLQGTTPFCLSPNLTVLLSL